MGLTDNRCLNRVMTGGALGCTVGVAIGACYGTYEAFSYGVSHVASEPATLTRRKHL